MRRTMRPMRTGMKRERMKRHHHPSVMSGDHSAEATSHLDPDHFHRLGMLESHRLCLLWYRQETTVTTKRKWNKMRMRHHLHHHLLVNPLSLSLQDCRCLPSLLRFSHPVSYLIL
jgi:hypothetical protein